MSRVFISQGTGAGVYVFSDDHCPPHVHARHRGDDWVARVSFSFISSAMELLSIAPLRNSPLQRTMNQLLDDIEAELPALSAELVGNETDDVPGKSVGSRSGARDHWDFARVHSEREADC